MMCLLFLLVKGCIVLAGEAGWMKEFQASPLETYVPEKSHVTVRGQVYQKEQKNKYQLIYLKENKISYLMPANQVPDPINHPNEMKQKRKMKEERILIQDSAFQHIRIGNEIEVKGTVTYFEQARNPGNFDQKFYYQKQGICGSIQAEEIMVRSEKADILKEWLCVFRVSWKEMLHQVLGEKSGPVLSAMLLGERGGIDPELLERFQKNGVGHILAISGLHMSFLGVGVYELLRRSGISIQTAGILGILFLFLYTGMIGGGVSGIRAFVMFSIRIGADICGRVYDGVTSLSVAALVTVGIQPLYLLDAGFLLSFGAVLGIQVVCPVLEAVWLSPHPKLRMPGKKLSLFYHIKQTLLKSLLASLSIHIMIFPIMLYFYFEFPPYSIFLNLLIIPLMPWVLGAGIIGSAFLRLVPVIGGLLLKSCGLVLAWYDLLCTQNLRLPFHSIVTGQPEKWKAVVYYVLLFGSILLFWSRRKQQGKEENRIQRWNRAKQGAVGMILILFLLSSPPKSGLNVAMLDIGQGDCIFLQSEKFAGLIDGGSSDVSSVGKYRIEPFLKSEGVASLDFVFISHGDADHINGIEEMLGRQKQGVRIQNLVLPPESVWDEKLKALVQTALSQKTKVYTMQQGEELQIGSLEVQCVQPEAGVSLIPGNEASMVLSIKYKEFTMLCTGDTEGMGETQLVQNLPRKDYTVLKVAHHGSKNSTKDAFLKVCFAPYALISAGCDNRYGHPHEETIRRLQEDGSNVITTQEAGAIMLWTDGVQVAVQTYH